MARCMNWAGAIAEWIYLARHRSTICILKLQELCSTCSRKPRRTDPGKSRGMLRHMGFFYHNDNTTLLQCFFISLTSLQDLSFVHSNLTSYQAYLDKKNEGWSHIHQLNSKWLFATNNLDLILPDACYRPGKNIYGRLSYSDPTSHFPLRLPGRLLFQRRLLKAFFNR